MQDGPWFAFYGVQPFVTMLAAGLADRSVRLEQGLVR